MSSNYSLTMCVFILYAASIGNILGAFLKVVTWLTILVLDLVLYFCVMDLSTLMNLFGVFSTSGVTWVWSSGGSIKKQYIFNQAKTQQLHQGELK